MNTKRSVILHSLRPSSSMIEKIISTCHIDAQNYSIKQAIVDGTRTKGEWSVGLLAVYNLIPVLRIC